MFYFKTVYITLVNFNTGFNYNFVLTMTEIVYIMMHKNSLEICSLQHTVYIVIFAQCNFRPSTIANISPRFELAQAQLHSCFKRAIIEDIGIRPVLNSLADNEYTVYHFFF